MPNSETTWTLKPTHGAPHDSESLDVSEERYCVDSGRPVQLIPGDRCLSHGARGVMCTTAVRDPRCEHPRLSKNHPYPKCEECGRSGQVAADTAPKLTGGVS